MRVSASAAHRMVLGGVGIPRADKPRWRRERLALGAIVLLGGVTASSCAEVARLTRNAAIMHATDAVKLHAAHRDINLGLARCSNVIIVCTV